MTVTAAGTDAATVGQSPDPASLAPAPGCRDCGTAYVPGANFCPHCGQETNIRLPRVFDFLREAADETIGVSGRLPRTLGLLLFRPGRLTNEYIAGHRQRYVRPMRLYLSVSLVFFATLGFATSDLGWIHLPSFDSKSAETDDPDGSTAPSAIQRKADSPQESSKAAAVKNEARDALPEVDLTQLGTRSKTTSPPVSETDGTPSIVDEIIRQFAREFNGDLDRDKAKEKAASSQPANVDSTGVSWLDERLNRYHSMSWDQIIRSLLPTVQGNAPYAVFILMPLAAFWYQLFYVFRGRRYAEHLLHTVHLHCFVFVIATVGLLPWLVGWRGWLFLLVGAYIFLAERSVYRSGWIRAFFGTFTGSILYLIGIVFVALGLTLVAVLSS